MRDVIEEWQRASFADTATAWVDGALSEVGHWRTNDLAPRKVRFWAAVFSAETTAGRVWFKVANPGQAFEGSLLVVLARVQPEGVIEPLAVDGARPARGRGRHTCTR